MYRAPSFVPLLLTLLVVPPLLLCGVSGFAQPADQDKEDPLRPFDKLKRGMTPEQVRQLVGVPKHIARQIFYHRYREQWIYDAAIPVRLTFDCPRGRKPQLLTIAGVPDNN
ncbi:MAG TPA: hypothetical protein VMF69_05280 [Gemmataceae bacterium]|nr:hypothetical protein [Gemmataceae bacterium]